MRRRTLLQAATASAFAPNANAAPRPLVVAELFTSQGCSSCPPADMLLTELAAARPNLLPLAFHVTYWDHLGWRDPFALSAATDRQRAYARLLRLDNVYTPQLVVAGTAEVVGSDRDDVLGALASAPPAAIALTVARYDGQAIIAAGPGPGAGSLLLVGYDRQHHTSIGRGENGGRTLLESNVVRSMVPAGGWSGAPLRLTAPAPEGERLALLLQAPDGRILGAAREDS